MKNIQDIKDLISEKEKEIFSLSSDYKLDYDDYESRVAFYSEFNIDNIRIFFKDGHGHLITQVFDHDLKPLTKLDQIK